MAVIHPLRAHQRQRDRGLAIVQRCQGEDETDRDVAAGRIDVHPETPPAFPVLLALRSLALRLVPASQAFGRSPPVSLADIPPVSWRPAKPTGVNGIVIH